jgi:tungstate transport system substrate-binding protein
MTEVIMGIRSHISGRRSQVSGRRSQVSRRRAQVGGLRAQIASPRLRGGQAFFQSLFCILGLLILVSPAQAQERLRLATTTSIQDSGLMPYLLQVFEKTCSCKVDVIAVGTGQALKLARNGDVDMVLVHDPAAEKKFLDEGWGINHQTFMMNDFVILGPPSDPAGIRGLKSATAAFSKIQKTRSIFISRGDDSGTHRKEMSIWQQAGIAPTGSWRLDIGQGMGAVLTMANEKGAYTLCDRSTFTARRNQLNLRVLVEGDPILLNYYSAMQVNPVKFPSAKRELAARFIHWLCSSDGQNRIKSFVVNGQQLFKPIYHRGK